MLPCYVLRYDGNRRYCKQYTAPRTCRTRKHFFACGSRLKCLCVFHEKTVIVIGTYHVSCATHTASPHSSSTSAQHSILALSSEREYHLQSAIWRSIWPSCRTEPKKQVMSPTILGWLAVRRLRLCSCPREEQALVRLTTLAETLLLLLHHRKWMKDQI